MFELNYKITQADVKKVNMSVMWMYFIPYMIASLVGIAVGITATVLRPRVEMLVLGIILIVLGAILLGCAILLVIAPKNFVVSALLPDEDIERHIKLTEENITVSTDGKADIIIDYYELTKLKLKKTYILAYIGKEQVLIIKDAILSGQTLSELFGFIKNRMGRLMSETIENGKDSADPSAKENDGATEQTENAENAESTDGKAEADEHGESDSKNTAE